MKIFLVFAFHFFVDMMGCFFFKIQMLFFALRQLLLYSMLLFMGFSPIGLIKWASQLFAPVLIQCILVLCLSINDLDSFIYFDSCLQVSAFIDALFMPVIKMLRHGVFFSSVILLQYSKNWYRTHRSDQWINSDTSFFCEKPWLICSVLNQMLHRTYNIFFKLSSFSGNLTFRAFDGQLYSEAKRVVVSVESKDRLKLTTNKPLLVQAGGESVITSDVLDVSGLNVSFQKQNGNS